MGAIGLVLFGLSAPAAARDPEPAGATAAAPVPPSADALRRAQRRLLERAKQRYEAGRGAGEAARPHLESALDALDLAYRLIPAPWLLFNMAQVQSRLGDCNAAAALYQQFLVSDPAPEARSAAEKALEMLGSCAGSQGEPAVEGGLSPSLYLSSSLDPMFTARPLDLPPAASEPAPFLHAAEDRVAVILPWAFGSLAVISGVAGAIYYAEARSAERELGRLRVAGPHVVQTQRRGESALDLARVFGGVSVGFALAAGACYWWLRPAADEAPLAATLERISVLPLEGGAGAAYRSEF